jgi:hypothetical protein
MSATRLFDYAPKRTALRSECLSYKVKDWNCEYYPPLRLRSGSTPLLRSECLYM